MKQNVLIIIISIIFILAIIISGLLTNWWQGNTQNIIPEPALKY